MTMIAEALASELLFHKKLYYTGRAKISDEAYDALEEKLRKISPEHPVLSLVGYNLASTGEKVAHIPPMLSLEKTYDVEALFEFVQKYSLVSLDKLDGMAMSLEYDVTGKLTRASTRGSGKAGENVTEHIFHIPSIPKRIPLQKKSRENLEFGFEVRGEVFFPKSAFVQFEDQFDSYRNAVPGTFGRKEIDEATAVLRVLKFCAYDLLLKTPSGKEAVHARNTPNYSGMATELGFFENTYLEKLKWLESQGFFTGINARGVELVKIQSKEELETFLTEYFSRERDHLIDGIVFRINDEDKWENLGVTSHHPRGSLAFKQTGDVTTTRILDIEENVGRSGKITFRAKLEPVYLSGAEISYATLHNAEFIEVGGYAPGAVVKIKRSGEVIPSIIGLESPPESAYKLPINCPCGYLLLRSGPELFCLEKRACPKKDQESLVHFVKGLGILGISDKIILKLRNAGSLTEPSDLFKLTVMDVQQIEGFALKSAENFIAAVEKHRRIPLASFLTALGLRRGGAVKCQEVAREFKTLAAVRKATAKELGSLHGWADKSAEDFVESLKEKSVVVDNLLLEVHVENDTSQISAGEQDESHPLFGKNICITGSLSRPRSEYKKILDRVGAKLSDGVSGTTSFLVCNEASGSSKYKQAVKFSVPILTEDELMQRFKLN